ncbi:Microfibrillar-associated protein 1 [Cyphellophora attinorum]|uniref:Microfibrillar-associated protein 1 n=1 Tax=Cyphellophora attinorum TaxID=1664694 RepID=A0A0N1H552_9EURO|nr:Microfibrillar-associated protein 1 [Phialophora attinorum]KPI36033.1 Microfibrillar-associated protein 1 [Phialophora attinorum]
MSSSKRMTAQPSRPVARYRPGKAIHEESSDEDESEKEQQAVPPTKTSAPRPQKQRPPPKTTTQEDSDEEGFVTDDDEDADGGAFLPSQYLTAAARPAATSQRPPPTAGDLESEAEPEEDSEEESGSDSDSSSVRLTALSTAKPLPIPTRQPQPLSQPPLQRPNSAKRFAPAASPKPTLPSPKRSTATRARALGRRAWDDDDPNLDPSALIDDTDDLDPAAEHAAWRLRELHRLKRDRDLLIAKEKEIEEVERRRNLSAAEREAEDRAHLDAQKSEKDGRAQAGFLARYHHKGAFFQDTADAEALRKRDLMGARFEDEVDKSALPEYMRIRDMNKLGKKGRTRYKDLREEDTGGFANDVRHWKGAMGAGGPRRDGGNDGMDYRSIDARFLPDDDRRQGGGPMSSGANNAPLGVRRPPRRRSRSTSRSRSPTRYDRDGDSYRARRRSSYSRSRSRSPPARRKRSASRDRYRDYEDGDKRRRVEAR